MRIAAGISGLVVTLLATGMAGAAEPAAYKDKAGPEEVATLEADWRDAARDVTVPVKVYYPKDLAKGRALPLIIFSHGLGGSRESYEPYGEHWASWGYVVIHPTHVGSDTSIALSGDGGIVSNLRDGISSESAQRRIKDVSFIIDQFEKMNAGTAGDNPAEGKALAAFKGRVDMKHIGMAGHSFGAQTTLQVAGETVKLGPIVRSSGDPRITAAIAMSPQPAIQLDQRAAFHSIIIPTFCITGTADDGPPGINEVKAAQRRIPYDNLPGPDDYLVIYKGATHMTFAPSRDGNTPGLRLRQLINRSDTPGDKPNTPQEETAIHSFVLQSTTAFWDAYLKGDGKAKAWLREDFAKVIGDTGKVEMKSAKP